MTPEQARAASAAMLERHVETMDAIAERATANAERWAQTAIQISRELAARDMRRHTDIAELLAGGDEPPKGDAGERFA